MSSNSIKSYKITGIPAVLIALILLGFAGFKLVNARASLPSEGLERIQMQLIGEYSSHISRQETLTLEEKADLLNAANELLITEYNARGKPDKMIVQIKLAPNEAQPLNSANTRYFEMKYSSLTGWQLIRETTPWSFRSNNFLELISVFE